jgi:hypothetical protein
MLTWRAGTASTGTFPLTRRAHLAAGGLAAGALTLAACGPQAPAAGGGDEAGAPLEKRKPVKLDFWGDPASDERKDQINAWNQKYPNLQVTFGTAKTTGQGVDAVAAITAAAAAGTPPHVVDFDRFQVNSFAARKVFQSPDGKKATLAGAQNQEALQYMADLMKDLGGWQALKAFKDTWGAVPNTPSSSGNSP